MKILSNRKISELKNLLEIQGQDGNWNADDYMQGMYNGMELVMAVIEDREPVFRGRDAKNDD